jgi:hypothetical protein
MAFFAVGKVPAAGRKSGAADFRAHPFTAAAVRPLMK